MANSASWAKIFRDYKIGKHDFDKGPFPITASYPYRQWKSQTTKGVTLLFFDKGHDGVYNIWQFGFRNELDYNSIYLIKSGRYIIDGPNSV